jgi:hypothetical protein
MSLRCSASRLLPCGIAGILFVTLGPSVCCAVEGVDLLSVQILLEITRVSLALIQILRR